MSQIRAISKKIIQTVNSNGNTRTIVDITNQRNNAIYKAQAISSKKDPKKFDVVHRSIEKKGNSIIQKDKSYRMKEKDLFQLFHSAEKSGIQNMKKFIKDKTTSKEKTDKKKILKKSSKKIKKKIIKKRKMKGGFESNVKGFDPHRFGDMAPFQPLDSDKNMKGGNK
jgi:hypothetical protein